MAQQPQPPPSQRLIQPEPRCKYLLSDTLWVLRLPPYSASNGDQSFPLTLCSEPVSPQPAARKKRGPYKRHATWVEEVRSEAKAKGLEISETEAEVEICKRKREVSPCTSLQPGLLLGGGAVRGCHGFHMTLSSVTLHRRYLQTGGSVKRKEPWRRGM